MKVDWKSLVKIVATTVVPVAFPKLTPAIPYIIHGIEEAEKIKGATGAQKLQTAIEITNAGANATNKIAGKDIIDINALNSTLGAGISAVVDSAKIFHKVTPDNKDE